MFIFYALFVIFFCIILLDKVLKWLLVALDSSDWTRICLGGLSIDRSAEVVIETGLTVTL